MVINPRPRAGRYNVMMQDQPSPTPAAEQSTSGLDVVLSGRTLRRGLVVGLGIAGIYLCYLLTVPFFTPITLALVLAILFLPLHRFIASRIPSSNVAAFITVSAIALLIVAVLLVLGAQLIEEAAAGAVLVQDAFDRGIVQDLIAAHPKVAGLVQSVLTQINAAGLAADLASRLTDMSASMVRASAMQMLSVVFTFYLLFYLFRDRDEAVSAFRAFLPFTDAEVALLYARAIDTVYATVFAIVVTGLLHGIVGGGLFAAFDLPAPFLWGTMMALFAILPVVGIGLIWMPAAVWIALKGDWVGAGVFSASFTALSITDSLLYPYVVGNRMRLHTAITFIAAVGGIIVFGAAGFVVGPVVIALVLALRDVLNARIQAQNGAAPEAR